MENTFDGLENECYDIDKVVEDISEMIRSVWTQHRETTINKKRRFSLHLIVIEMTK